MASFTVDLTLCEITPEGEALWEPTYPGTPERTETIRQILLQTGVRPGSVDVEVLQEQGPAGGNPEVKFSGPRDEVAKVVAWAIEGMNEDPEWADEYWTDRS